MNFKIIISLFVIILILGKSYGSDFRVQYFNELQNLHGANYYLYKKLLIGCQSKTESLQSNITLLQGNIENHSAIIRNNTLLIDCVNKTLIATRNELVASKNAIVILEQHLETNKTALNQTAQAFDLQKTEISELNNTIARLNDHIQQLEDAATKDRKIHDDQTVELMNTEQKLKNSNNQINEKNIEIAELKSKLDSRDEKISELNNIITAYTTFCKASSCEPFGNSTSVHAIDVSGFGPFRVLCNSQLNGPGWTVIQRRINGNVDFKRNWTEYRNGFGNLSDEFFIGLEKLHHMTAAEPQEVFIQLKFSDGESLSAKYDHFEVGNELEFYTLKSLGVHSGDLENLLTSNTGQRFSTYDQDHDSDDSNCAEDFEGGWWFNHCGLTNLNGPYPTQDDDYTDKNKLILWGDDLDPIKSVQIMIRPKKLSNTK